MGALSYADDITISCPNLYGLNIMLYIYNYFAHDNFITFNKKKTVCIKFGELIKPQEYAKFDGHLLKWQTNVRHLGNYLNSALDNYVDRNIKYSQFIGQFNSLKSKFGFLQPDMFSNLFKSYCYSFMVRFYGNIVQVGLRNVVHNGINRLGILFRYNSHCWCCCLPTPMTLASGGCPMFLLVVHQPASPSIWPAVQSLRRGLSTYPGVTMWCVCGCS